MNARWLLIPAAALTLAVVSPGDDRTKDRPNAQMQAVLDEFAALGPKPIEKLRPEEARKQPTLGKAVENLLKKQKKSTAPEAVAKVTDITIEDAGIRIPLRVYSPEGKGAAPVLVYFHGGGWVLGDLNTYDASCRALCNAAGCVVVSCGYRLAPESTFPAATNDALATYKWVLEHAAEVGGDPKRVAVGGESAGGNLAAVTVLRARNDGIARPVHQLLVYPVTDLASFDRPSYKAHADAKPLNRAMMEWFKKEYVKDEVEAAKQYASPLRAKTLKDLPPATVITADIDPLRDDGRQYAIALTKAGVDVVYKKYDGVTHEFFGMGAVVDEGKQAVAFAAKRLTGSWGR